MFPQHTACFLPHLSRVKDTQLEQGSWSKETGRGVAGERERDCVGKEEREGGRGGGRKGGRESKREREQEREFILLIGRQ